jgi:hypothetical protein
MADKAPKRRPPNTVGPDFIRGLAGGLVQSSDEGDRVMGGAMAAGVQSADADDAVRRQLWASDEQWAQTKERFPDLLEMDRQKADNDLAIDIATAPKRIDLEAKRRRALTMVDLEMEDEALDRKDRRDRASLDTFRAAYPFDAEADGIVQGVDGALDALQPSAHLGRRASKAEALAALHTGDPVALEAWTAGSLADGRPAISLGEGPDRVVIPLRPSEFFGFLEHRQNMRETLAYRIRLDRVGEQVREQAAQYAASNPAAAVATEAIAAMTQIDPERAAYLLARLPGDLAASRNDATEAAIRTRASMQDSTRDVLLKSLFGTSTEMGPASRAIMERRRASVESPAAKAEKDALERLPIYLVDPVVARSYGFRDGQNLPGFFDRGGLAPGHVRDIHLLAGVTLRNGQRVFTKTQPPHMPFGRYGAREVSEFAAAIDRFAQEELGWPPSDPNAVLASVIEAFELSIEGTDERGEVAVPGGSRSRSEASGGQGQRDGAEDGSEGGTGTRRAAPRRDPFAEQAAKYGNAKQQTR